MFGSCLSSAHRLNKKDNSPDATAYYKSVLTCRNNQREYLETTEAQNLCMEAHVDLTANRGGVYILELRQFQYFLNDYYITVFTDRRGKDPMFEGSVDTPDHPRKYIDLIFGDNHYVCHRCLFSEDRLPAL